jgi:hypothetical protein
MEWETAMCVQRNAIQDENVITAGKSAKSRTKQGIV